MSFKKSKEDLIHEYHQFGVLKHLYKHLLEDFLQDESFREDCYSLYNRFKDASNLSIVSGGENVSKEIVFLCFYMSCIVDKMEFELREHGLFLNGALVPEVTKSTQELCDLSDSFIGYYQEFGEINQKVDSLYQKCKELNLEAVACFKEKTYLKKLAIQKVVNVLSVVSPYREDDYIRYITKGAKFGSLQCKMMLVKYYCDKDHLDLLRAMNIFHEISNIDLQLHALPNETFNIPALAAYVTTYGILFKGLLNNCLYKEAREVSIKIKKFIETIDDDMVVFDATKEQLLDVIEGNLNIISKKISEDTIRKIDELAFQKYFSEKTISILPVDAKVFIATSIDIYNFILRSKNSYDYSACIMPIMKAVEMLLYKIIGVEYLNFLHTIEKPNYRYIDKKLKIQIDERVELVDSISIIDFGTAIYSMAYKHKYDQDKNNLEYNPSNEIYYSPNQYFLKFCKENNVEKPEETIKHISYVLDLVRDIRNLAAHKNKVIESDAKRCEDYLLTYVKLIEFVIDRFAFCFK